MTSDPPLSVLIIDACDSTRDSLMVAFEARGLVCRGTADGETGLELVRAGPAPGTVLVAYHLPHANGAETTRCLKLICPHVRVIATSTEHARRDEMLAAGAVAFLGKPFDVNDFLLAVTGELGSHSPASLRVD